MALLPLCGAMVWRPKKPYWLLAVAFGVSWIGDWMWKTWGMEDAVYLWLPVQVGLVLWALVPSRGGRRVIIVAVPAVGLFSAAYSAPNPEFVMTVLAAVAILHLSIGRAWIPLYLYFGLGTVSYFLMMIQATTGNGAEGWYMYQGCRLAAYVAFLCGLPGQEQWTT